MALALSTYRRLPGFMRRAVVRTVAPTYVVGVVAVFRNGAGDYLLLRERHHTGWALPGGLLNRGETPEAALVREVHEEIGVMLPDHAIPEPQITIAPHAQRVDVIYEIDADDDMRPTAKEPEVLEAAWFSLSNLPELGDPTEDLLAAVGISVHAGE